MSTEKIPKKVHAKKVAEVSTERTGPCYCCKKTHLLTEVDKYVFVDEVKSIVCRVHHGIDKFVPKK